MNIIEKGYNPRTGGYYAFFEHDGYEFYADLSYTFDAAEECMIFASKDKQVTSWRDLYCKRGIPVTESDLLDCIEEFVTSLNAF